MYEDMIICEEWSQNCVVSKYKYDICDYIIVPAIRHKQNR